MMIRLIHTKEGTVFLYVNGDRFKLPEVGQQLVLKTETTVKQAYYEHEK